MSTAMMKRSAVAAFAATLALTGSTAAQHGPTGSLFDASPLADLVPQDSRSFPQMRRPTAGMKAGDFNQDGIVDLIVARDGTTDMLWWGRGSGRFERASTNEWPDDDRPTTDAVLGDTDGDGDLDVLLPQLLGGIRHLTNTGQGFTDTTAARVGNAQAIAYTMRLVDLDFDSKPEAILCSNFQPAQVWQQDSSGVFQDATPLWISTTPIFSTALEIADLNGDNRPDVVIGNTVLFNDGWTLTEQQKLPVPSINSVRCVAAGDVDGDGRVDLLVGTSQGRDLLFLNSTESNFSEAPTGNYPLADVRTFDLEMGDLDGDGDLDALVATYGSHDQLLLNNGQGVFAPTTSPDWLLALSSTGSRSVDIADLNGDGWQDAIIGRGHASAVASSDRILLVSPHGIVDINRQRVPAVGGSPAAVETGDLDGDGDPDVVVSRNNGEMTILWNHHGVLTADIGMFQPVGFNPHVRDTDNDGRAELITRAHSGAVHVRHYSGSADPLQATWSTSSIVIAEQSPGLVVADCDGDGWQDFVRARDDGASQGTMQLGVVTADGQGGYLPVAWERALVFTDASTMASIDVDQDQRSDVAALALDGTLSIAHRSATEFSHASVVTPPGNRGFSLVVADFNGDGIEDMFVGRENMDQMLLGTMNGGFQEVTNAVQIPAVQPTYGLVTGDLDGDGDLDLVRSHGYHTPMTILENDGTGIFTPMAATKLPEGLGQSYHAEVFDVDMDGDLDILRLAPDVTELWINRTVQLDTDQFPVAGQSIDIHLTVHPANPPSLLVASLIVGKPGAPSYLPYISGKLRMDVSDMTVFPLIALQYTSQYTWSVQVPAGWASLMSTDLAAQAVIWEPAQGTPIRFTNRPVRPLLR